MSSDAVLKSAFVTGATGLLGNNLVRALVAEGVHVRALARSAEKAARQFADLPEVEIVTGDLASVEGFAQRLTGVDVVFHTAAFFRDSYKGGSHRDELMRTNVEGAKQLLEAVYRQGVRHFVHTSSVATLEGEPGATIDESNRRNPDKADDYYLSKILSDLAVEEFLQAHPDMRAAFVLPGWMWGPGDIGPTSAGQFALDLMKGRLPGLVPGSFSFVDARDVAFAEIVAARKLLDGSLQSGERFLAAGRHMTMADLIPEVARIGGVSAPSRRLPFWLLYALAGGQEVYSRLTGKPILLSLATVRLMAQEADRSHYSAAKSNRVLGLAFRPPEATIRDTLAWYRGHGFLAS